MPLRRSDICTERSRDAAYSAAEGHRFARFDKWVLRALPDPRSSGPGNIDLPSDLMLEIARAFAPAPTGERNGHLDERGLPFLPAPRYSQTSHSLARSGFRLFERSKNRLQTEEVLPVDMIDHAAKSDAAGSCEQLGSQSNVRSPSVLAHRAVRRRAVRNAGDPSACRNRARGACLAAAIKSLI